MDTPRTVESASTPVTHRPAGGRRRARPAHSAPKAGPVPSPPLAPAGSWKTRFTTSIQSRDMLTAAKVFRENQHTIDPKTWEPDLADAWFVDHCARLLDRKAELLPFVQALLTRFHEVHAPHSVPTPAWGRLRLAEAVILLHQHALPLAIDGLTFTLELATQTRDDELAAMTRYYLARAYYKTGQSGRALDLIKQADEWLDSRQPIAAALCKMVEAMVMFNTSVEDAEAALGAAKRVLWRCEFTEDANIVAMEGRLQRQIGNFQGAFNSARESARLFEDNGAGDHANCARAYVHMAFARMLQAKAEGLPADDEERDGLQEEVLDLLASAETICQRPEHARVLDRVHYFRAFWYAMVGNDAAARRHAKQAYETAETAHDHVVMAHALIVLCQCARNESDRTAARGRVQEAKIMADKTDNRRVKARVLIWNAFVESDPPTHNNKAAEKLMEDAAGLMHESDRDYLRWEFDLLSAHIAEAKRRQQDEALGLPATLDDILTREAPLDSVLNDAARKIVLATYRRVGTIQKTAEVLITTRARVRRLCPELKR